MLRGTPGKSKKADKARALRHDAGR
ncbi:hypothetical protein BCEP27_110156 [Burkholderia cepacia]